jgi:hypothetical protein
MAVREMPVRLRGDGRLLAQASPTVTIGMVAGVRMPRRCLARHAAGHIKNDMAQGCAKRKKGQRLIWPNSLRVCGD